MRPITLWFSATTTALVLLFTNHTSQGAATASGTTAATGVVSSTVATKATAASRTVNGSIVRTRYGDIQVQVVLRGSTVVKATAIAYSTQGHNGEINAYAVPALQSETLKAQSARIDTVSGATYTSNGYIKSLQAALDAAHAA